ncbi:hypothetical protein HYW32_03045 [Candidatus Berkelbacteria bacterium]|nr:hypothetical protein [Candidatus Berkelbacteria bacterium]
MRILLIQCRTDASQAHEQYCVQTHAGQSVKTLTVVNPIIEPGSVQAAGFDYDAVILGGSGEFQLSRPTPELGCALDELCPILDQILERELPFLGMCFGHQILAWHLGMPVEENHEESQIGSFEVSLSENGQADPIFQGIPATFIAQHGHKDCVMRLPLNATHLASGARHCNDGYRIGSRAYGLQFHPELTLDDLIERLKLYPSYLKGKTLEEARGDFQASPEAPKVLKNFFALARIG